MKYGFIGCGNMGGAIAKALSTATREILVCDRSGKAKALAGEWGIGYSEVSDIAARCDRIFIAVKPYMVRDVLAPLQGILEERKPLLITMAAGISMEELEAMAGTPLPIIRIMPNTPTAMGKGVIPYCYNDLVDGETLRDWRADMGFCGLLDPLEERLMDAASALSGSGPAFCYMFAEALADGAVACGLPRAKAMEYAAMTLSGAAEMLLATGQHPGALKDAVCSPGGSTIVGVKTLETRGFRGAVMECVMNTFEKNKNLL